jgi:calpain-15
VTASLKKGLEEAFLATAIETERPIQEYPFFKTRLQDIDYKAIIAAKGRWEDPYFRHDASSLFDPEMEKTEENKKWQKYEWKRASEVWPQAQMCIYKEISPNDIKQGFCGDCYFLSSISSLAEFPERVKAIFITKEINDAGCYALQLYVNGEPVTVVVDDYFPWHPFNKDWAFSRSNGDHEIWVMLLEKAWAKVFGSYQRIEGGQAGEALPALTGAPVTVLNHEEIPNIDKLWKIISYADRRNFVIGTTV